MPGFLGRLVKDSRAAATTEIALGLVLFSLVAAAGFSAATTAMGQYFASVAIQHEADPGGAFSTAGADTSGEPTGDTGDEGTAVADAGTDTTSESDASPGKSGDAPGKSKSQGKN